MCVGGGDSNSSSSGHASAEVTFNPIISIGGNSGEPGGQDTSSTFAARLLSSPTVAISTPKPDKTPDNSTRKILVYIAVALAARKVLSRG
jgi:hypothetical protein